jgi:hypothetical protein
MEKAPGIEVYKLWPLNLSRLGKIGVFCDITGPSRTALRRTAKRPYRETVVFLLLIGLTTGD